MPSPPHYPQYYMPQGHPLPPHQYQQGGPSPYPTPMQIDPALSVYPPAPPHHQYTNYVPPPLQLPPDNHNHNHNKNTPSTPSSEASSSMSPSTSKQPSSDPNSNGKRPAPPTSGGGSKKKLKKENPAEPDSSRVEIAEPIKIKSTRGSRACTVCRRLKMKCVGAEQGPPCKRCAAGGHECIFEESNRGKRSSKKHEMLTKSLRKMEKTLDTVLRSISNPGITSLASGMVSRSPSPSGDEGPSGPTAATHALIEQSSAASPAADSSSHHGSWSGYNAADSRRNPDTFRPSKFPAPPLSGFSAAAMQNTTGAFGGPARSSSPKLHSLPDNNLNPLGLLAEASLANSRNQQASRSAQASASSASSAAKSRGGAPAEVAPEAKVGVANDGYFKPGPINFLPLRRLYIERQVQPEMLTFVSTDEVVDLFKIFFDRMTPHCALLERDWHTPSLVCSRSPFLLTTICSIASKFYDKKPELHPKLTSLARKLAFSVPEKGYKSVEIVQAYLLLSLWGCGPVERYEQDKTWMLLGMGIRMATDLNLHRKSNNNSQETEEGKARDKEVHNRERTWMLCFVLDRSFSAQMGKPHSIKEDFIIRSATQWWRTPQAIPSDVGICAYVELQRILSRSLDFLYSGTQSASGLQMDCDYLLVIKTIEAQLIAWEADWSSAERSLGVTEYRVHVGKFYYYYAMLVVNSFGLQNALERSPVDIGHFFGRCHSSATACALVVRDELAPRGYLRYSPDSHFVLCSYAVLTLLKLIRPEFQAFMDNEAKTIALVKDMADTLEGVAAGPLHTPALYSTFLRALISAKLDGPPSGSRPESPRPRSRGNEPAAGGGPNDTPAPAAFDPFATTAGAGSNGPAMMFDYAGLNGEMGPGLDGTAFMQSSGGDIMSMDSILSQNFWDSVLIPGYSSHFEGLSGGFVYGVGGSGFITPRMTTPYGSGSNTPSKGVPQEITGPNLARAFETAGIEPTASAVTSEV